MADYLCRANHFFCDTGKRQLIENAFSAVWLDQPLDRQKGGGECCDPQRSAADSAE
jgi:hypothetical protein